MESKRELTKCLLAESFKELLIKGSFDKITIKTITDQAGVIRPTFYNYFQDKYEVMEWLLETEVFQSAREMVASDLSSEAIHLIFKKMEKDRVYYQKAFEVTGQNGFEEILTREVKELVELLMDKHGVKAEKMQGLRNREVFILFQTISVVNGVKYWITNKKATLTADEAMEFWKFMMSHSILEIVDWADIN
ncbi:MAG: TetR family transcriptional regulator [Bariatricus sp.]